MRFDPTKPVRTRDGRPARIITTERKCPMGQNIVALVSAMHPYAEEIAVFTSDGTRDVRRRFGEPCYSHKNLVGQCGSS
jgi:hypothetical protein